MFVNLLVASFLVALALSATIAWISKEAIDAILRRFVVDYVVRAGFEKYIRFAIVAVGVSGGTRVKPLQEYISAADYNKPALLAALTREFSALECIAGSLALWKASPVFCWFAFSLRSLRPPCSAC